MEEWTVCEGIGDQIFWDGLMGGQFFLFGQIGVPDFFIRSKEGNRIFFFWGGAVFCDTDKGAEKN